MILSNFLSTIYDKVTSNSTDLTANFVGRFERTDFEREGKLETVRHYTLAFEKTDHRTLKVGVRCHSELSSKIWATTQTNDYSFDLTKVRCWTEKLIKIDETVVDSRGIALKMTGTGIFVPAKNTIWFALKMDDRGKADYFSVNAFKV
jgi:hypothetical protein